MSRHEYTDDCDDQWGLIRWRGAVNSAIKGRRGQAFLKEMVEALEALPEKKLISDELMYPDGSVCAIGAVGRLRGMKPEELSEYEAGPIAAKFGISRALACEIMFENDDGDYWSNMTPEKRWEHMVKWCKSQIKEKQ